MSYQIFYEYYVVIGTDKFSEANLELLLLDKGLELRGRCKKNFLLGLRKSLVKTWVQKSLANIECLSLTSSIGNS